MWASFKKREKKIYKTDIPDAFVLLPPVFCFLFENIVSLKRKKKQQKPVFSSQIDTQLYIQYDFLLCLSILPQISKKFALFCG